MSQAITKYGEILRVIYITDIIFNGHTALISNTTERHLSRNIIIRL